MSRTTVKGTRKGFTLVELAVVIVIIGVLAAFGVPQFLKSVERSKAAEAFNYLSAVRAAQERYLAQNGAYSDDLTALDIKQVAPTYFGGGDDGEAAIAVTAPVVDSGKPTWYCTLTRKSATSSYSYTVTFDQNGFVPTTGPTADDPCTDAPASTITGDISPMGT